MRHVWVGARLLFKNRSLWALAAGPLVLSAVAYAVVLVGGFWLVVPRVTDFASHLGWPDAVGWITGSAMFSLVWLLASGPVFFALFALFAVPCWDGLSKRAERLLGGRQYEERLGFGAFVGDVVLRVSFTLGAALIAFVLGWAGLGWVSALLVGWVMLFDLTAPSCLRRGAWFLRQPSVVFHRRGWAGLWLSAALVSLVPVANVLLLPVLVLAGTHLVWDGGASDEPVWP